MLVRLSQRLVTDSAGHDIPAPASGRRARLPPGAPPATDNETALRFVPHSPAAGQETGKEKDPGSAFGPESVPLATGQVPVVYWVPGPFPGPTPRPAG